MGGWAMSSLHAGQGSRDVRQQAADALARMTAALGEVGFDAKNLAHVTIWLSDLAATQAVTEICGSLLPALPATTIVRTSFPSPGALVGVEGIAG
jgi:enamine deaminase RidA (YjgF/YER057c/UK114 family)